MQQSKRSRLSSTTALSIEVNMKITKRQLRRIIKERVGVGHHMSEPAHRRSGLGRNVADVEFPILVRYAGKSEVLYDRDSLDELLDDLGPGVPYSLDSLSDVEAGDVPVGRSIEMYGEHASLTEKKEQIEEDDELSPDDYLDTAAAIFENKKIRITRRQLRQIIAETYEGNPAFDGPAHAMVGFKADPHLKGSYEGNGLVPGPMWQNILPNLEAANDPFFGPAIEILKTREYLPRGNRNPIHYIPFKYGDEVLKKLSDLGGADEAQIDKAAYELDDRDREYADPYDDY